MQEALTRKIVTELNGFDNLFFEICNEAYFGGVTIPWQHHIADVIVETERGLPREAPDRAEHRQQLGEGSSTRIPRCRSSTFTTRRRPTPSA